MHCSDILLLKLPSSSLTGLCTRQRYLYEMAMKRVILFLVSYAARLSKTTTKVNVIIHMCSQSVPCTRKSNFSIQFGPFLLYFPTSGFGRRGKIIWGSQKPQSHRERFKAIPTFGLYGETRRSVYFGTGSKTFSTLFNFFLKILSLSLNSKNFFGLLPFGFVLMNPKSSEFIHYL